MMGIGVALRVSRAQPDVAETGDAGVARREVAAATVVRAHHQIDLVASLLRLIGDCDRDFVRAYRESG